MQQILALLAFAAGAFLPCFYLNEPGFLTLIFAFIFLAGIFYLYRRYWLVSFFIGLVYGTHAAVSFHQLLLPDELNNQTFLVEGKIIGLPEQGDRLWRLNLLANSIRPVSGELPELFRSDVPRKMRLSYYGNVSRDLRPGDQLVFEARLRRPHGLMNPGLFDYKRWLIGQSTSATGYVSQLIEHDSSGTPDWRARLDRWRLDKSTLIQKTGVVRAGIQSALVVGDRRYIEADVWELFVDTGVVHLMVISGLHVGFVAGMAYFIGRWLLSITLLSASINSHRWANLIALLAATLYAGLAGFSTPTLRAVIMLSAVLLPRLFFLKTSPWWGLSVALATIAVLDPRAVLQTGFWLSFLAVVLIFLSLKTQEKEGFFYGLIRIQLVFLVGFSGVILLVQGQFNPLTFVANLVAVPMTSLFVVPLEVFGLLISMISSDAGPFFWGIAGRALDLMVLVLGYVVSFSDWRLHLQPLPFWLAALPALSGLTLLYWSKWWQRSVALILMLPLVIPVGQVKPFLEMSFFDVGQGLAVLIRQPGYSLLYDTGPRFSDAFDAGKDILLPSLRRLSIDRLDDLIISHPDADHIGGYPGLNQGLVIERIWIGRQSRKTENSQECLAGQRWQVGSVSYAILSPFEKDPGPDIRTDNDRSCVLRIEFGDQSILLPGDIGRSVESQMLKKGLLGEQTVVLIPHHGSKSSSSPDFVQTTRPMMAIASAGYLNRFGHPVPEVTARYQNIGARVLSTNVSGMIKVTWRDASSIPEVQTEANRRIFWWQK